MADEMLPTEHLKKIQHCSRGVKISVAVCLLLFLVVVSLTLISSSSGKRNLFVSSVSASSASYPESNLFSSSALASAPTPFSESNFLASSTRSLNASHILFAIGGSAATWSSRKEYTALWWNSSVTRGFVWLDEKPSGSLKNFHGPTYRISAKIPSNFPPVVRLATLIRDSFNLRLPGVRWFVIGDDDTVFFVDNLVSVLSRYDDREMWYIGDSSESVEQDVIHSYALAFGGGGYAISYPLAEKLVAVLDDCLNTYSSLYGADERIRACIAEIGVPLTHHRGFHQFDIRGSAYGLLAAHPVAPLVSVHHLDYLDPLFPNKTRLGSVKLFVESYKADPARFVQQTICYHRTKNWTLSVSSGFTAQLYPLKVSPIDLQCPLQTFKTWRSQSDGPFTVKTRLVPSSDPCEGPVIYMVDGVKKVGRRLRTSYTSFGPIQGQPCLDEKFNEVMSVKQIVALSEESGPEFWSEAPRRECCDFDDDGMVKNRTLQVRIRRCRSTEILAG